MREETEDVFSYVLHEDRSLLELIDSDYTFLNERLAHQYGITNVTGEEMRRVTLPPDSPRGGVLTEGTVLVVTSNPTRTSPVKRGLFILDSILGTPPPPPPANIPPLEDAAKGLTNRPPACAKLWRRTGPTLVRFLSQPHGPAGPGDGEFQCPGHVAPGGVWPAHRRRRHVAHGESFSNFRNSSTSWPRNMRKIFTAL
jgi:hypothetical protein